MYFDTHAHYDDEAFDADRDALLASMPEQGVELIVDPGCGERSSLLAMELARKFAHVYAAVGWHPQEADDFDDASEDKLRAWAREKKVVAIGEIGLDYYYEGASREKQKDVFSRQLALARELSLPAIVHDREAHADCMEIVRRFPGVRGVFHCYSGSVEMARELLSLGWYLSFTGAVTFKSARKAPEVIRVLPDNRFMIETDAPYLTPVPYRGKRNDSTRLAQIAERIAEIRDTTPEAIAALTKENGLRFFGIQSADSE